VALSRFADTKDCPASLVCIALFLLSAIATTLSRK
jgi:hypothetical protein